MTTFRRHKAPAAAALSAAAVSLVVATAAPSVAATGTLKDARHDAPAVRDITSLTVHNNSRAITAVFHVRDLRRSPGLTAGVFYVARARDSWGYGVTATAPTAKRRGEADLWRGYNYAEDARTVHCPGMRVRWRFGKDRLVIRVPRSCIRASVTRVSPSAWMDSNRPTIGQDSVPDPYGTTGPWVAKG